VFLLSLVGSDRLGVHIARIFTVLFCLHRREQQRARNRVCLCCVRVGVCETERQTGRHSCVAEGGMRRDVGADKGCAKSERDSDMNSRLWVGMENEGQNTSSDPQASLISLGHLAQRMDEPSKMRPRCRGCFQLVQPTAFKSLKRAIDLLA
jgi:hypothetical protein